MRGNSTVPVGNKRRKLGVVDIAFILLIGFAILLFIFAALIPRIGGYHAYAISSGSMEPTLSRGDLLFIETIPFEELEEGNVVAFQMGGTVVIHRAVSIDRQGETFRTKADSSNQLDETAVDTNALVGRAAYKIPLLGYVSLWLSGKGGGE